MSLRFTETELEGVHVIDIDPRSDDRGFFARTWCRREMEEHGLPGELVQVSLSFNPRRGTLRGLHYQAAPHEESKVVRCTRGAIHDVVVDLRPESPTWRQWVAVELTQDNRRAVYVPPGVAHGFQSLTDDAEVLYQISAFHRPESARGVRWDDPAFGIVWPSTDERTMSERDAGYADYQGSERA